METPKWCTCENKLQAIMRKKFHCWNYNWSPQFKNREVNSVPTFSKYTAFIKL